MPALSELRWKIGVDKQDSGSASNAPDKMIEIDLRQLMGDRREICILHEGERYILRITSKGRLILTK